MRIGFYSNDILFDPDSLTTRGIGGSESSVLNISKEWKKHYQKDEIIIYNNNSGKYNKYNDITIKSVVDFYLEMRTFNLDAIISLRDPSIFKFFIDSKLKVLWSQDITNESRLINLQKNKYIIESIDLFFANSQFSYNDLKNGFPKSNIKILKNGYNQNWIDTNEKENIAIYNSVPFRGLSYLLELWPKIHRGCQNYNIDPKLEIYGGMDLYNQSNEYFKNLYDNLSKVINTTVFGSLPQRELYKKMCKSKLLLYPNIWVETSCMSMIEAMACGNWSISTNLGALNELIIDNISGNIINGDPESEEYKNKFIKYSINAFVENKRPNIDHLKTWSEQAKLMRNEIEEIL